MLELAAHDGRETWEMRKSYLVVTGLFWILSAEARAQGMTADLIAESDGDFSRPHDVVLAPDEQFLYVADVGNNAVKVLDPTTLKTIGVIGEKELRSPHDVAFDREGRLLVADTGNHRIAIFTVNGAQGTLSGKLREGLRKPEGVAVGPDGAVYVTSASRDNVVKFVDGALVGDVGKSGNGPNEFIRPHDIEVTVDGRVVIADPGNNRLQVLSPDLAYITEIGEPAYIFNEPKYFASDQRGRLYIADEYNNRIVILNRDYELFGRVATGERQEGARVLHHPEGADVSGRRLWIADTGHHRIVLYQLKAR